MNKAHLGLPLSVVICLCLYGVVITVQLCIDGVKGGADTSKQWWKKYLSKNSNTKV